MRNSLYLLVCMSAVLLAQSGEHPVSPSPAKLKPLHWMIGQWKGEGTCMGQPYKEEFTVGLVYEGHFLRAESKTWMAGKLVWTGIGMTGYDLDKDQLTTFVFGMDGGIGRATFKQGENENIWILEGSTSGISPFKKYVETLTRKSDDEFSLSLRCTEGLTNADMKCRFQRVKAEVSPAKGPGPAKTSLPQDPAPAKEAAPSAPAPAREPAAQDKAPAKPLTSTAPSPAKTPAALEPAAAAPLGDIILPRVSAR